MANSPIATPAATPGSQATADQQAADALAVAPAVQAERVAMLLRFTPLPVMAGAVLASLQVWVLWGFVPAAHLGLWLAAKWALALARLAQLHLARRQTAHAPRLGAVFMALLLADGLCWGLFGVVLHPPGMPEMSALIMASVLGAVGAASIFTLGSDFRANVLFSCALLLPGLAMNLARNTPESLMGAAGLGFFLVMLLIEARRIEFTVVEALQLRFSAARSAAQRQEALQVAEHASRSKSSLIATISHEVRTPLNGILGMSQMLLRTPLAAQQRECMGVLQRSGQHLLAMVNDVLDFAKSDAGKLALRPETFELRRNLHDVLDLFSSAASAKGLALQSHGLADLPAWAVGDPARLKQVLHNLIGNAVKFTSHGHVQVGFQWLAHGRDATLWVQVVDTGDGIAAEELPQLFAPFHQARENRRHNAGTGLGLAIARQLALAMEGDIVCESTLGAGSTFTFTCTLQPALAPHDDDAELLSEAPLQGQILVVDDNPVNLIVATAMLESMGLSCATADNGEAALRTMYGHDFDLVLMDVEMPLLNGIDATRRWREHERSVGTRQRLPIVALTANAMVADRERVLAAGMDGCMVKPILRTELHAQVAALLQARRGEAARAVRQQAALNA